MWTIRSFLNAQFYGSNGSQRADRCYGNRMTIPWDSLYYYFAFGEFTVIPNNFKYFETQNTTWNTTRSAATENKTKRRNETLPVAVSVMYIIQYAPTSSLYYATTSAK